MATAASVTMTGFGTFLAARTGFSVGATLLTPVGEAAAPAPAVGAPEAVAEAVAVADGEAVAVTGVAETSPESFP
jgi:hypothetical protein